MSRLWEAVAGPLGDYAFMRNGLVVAAIVGVTSATLSAFLVVRRQALLGDALSHAVLLGVAVGWLVARHLGVLWGSLAAGILTSVGITYVERNSRVKLDAAMGILSTFAFALGLAVISLAKPRGIDLFHVLLGNVLGVSRADLVLTAASGVVVLVVVALLFKELHLWSFDPGMARAVGMPTTTLHYAFAALLSVTVVAALQAVGLVLVVAMLVTPGATAYLLTSRLAAMILVAAAVGLVSAVGGLYGSFYLDVASGPAIVLVASACFLVSFLFAPRHGVVTRVVLRRRGIRRAVEEDLLKAVLHDEREGSRHGTATAAELADRVGVPALEARRATADLVSRGLLVEHGDGVRLSPAGEREALRVVRAHRLLERYLYDAERLPLEDLHAEADRMEHDVPTAVVDDLDRTMGRPAVDPHGHPIPTSSGELAAIAGRPLGDSPAGMTGRVSMVRDDRDDLLREMVRLGILPQELVTVVGHEGEAVRVRMGTGERAIPADVAARVFVVPVSS